MFGVEWVWGGVCMGWGEYVWSGDVWGRMGMGVCVHGVWSVWDGVCMGWVCIGMGYVWGWV